MTIRHGDDSISLKKLITIITACSLIAGGGGAWATLGAQIDKVADAIAVNTEADELHHGDVSKHMPFEAKVQKFVTRVEFERFVSTTAQLDERQRKILEVLARIEATLAKEEKK